jgi:hypothetical protein
MKTHFSNHPSVECTINCLGLRGRKKGIIEAGGGGWLLVGPNHLRPWCISRDRTNVISLCV